jgi:hypothetical protein
MGVNWSKNGVIGVIEKPFSFKVILDFSVSLCRLVNDTMVSKTVRI